MIIVVGLKERLNTKVGGRKGREKNVLVHIPHQYYRFLLVCALKVKAFIFSVQYIYCIITKHKVDNPKCSEEVTKGE